DVLIDLFEAQFIEPQNALGAHVRALFRDIDRPDHFVWIRSFADMQTRLAALEGFYGGQVWATHGAAANATMIDSDDVHLLQAVDQAFPARRRCDGAFFQLDILPEVSEAELEKAILGRKEVVGAFRTLAAENNFPRLPVHSHKVGVMLRIAVTSAGCAAMAGLLKPLATRRLLPTLHSPLQLGEEM
ncbi:MAG: NIPSNAP family protein, partial [Hyphomicrobiaceae bacterium]|nr:NIPSNAP family protein [Hyphomicrobiaceae bacterium]